MNLEHLIGLDAHDERLRDFVRRLGQEPQVYEMAADDPNEGKVLVFKLAGLQISFDKTERVNVVHVFSQGQQGYGQYSGALPKGLSFAMSQAAARALLGAPSRIGGPVEAIIGNDVTFWDRWDDEDYVLHVSYPGQRDCISRITIMRPDRAPA